MNYYNIKGRKITQAVAERLDDYFTVTEVGGELVASGAQFFGPRDELTLTAPAFVGADNLARMYAAALRRCDTLNLRLGCL
jgi:hypothetical protein